MFSNFAPIWGKISKFSSVLNVSIKQINHPLVHIPVVCFGSRGREVLRVAFGDIGRGAGTGMTGQRPRRYRSVMDGDGEVHPVFQLEFHRVADGDAARSHRHAGISAEGEGDGSSFLDGRAFAHRLRDGNLDAQDFRRRFIVEVGQVEAQFRAADGYLYDLAERVSGEAGLRRKVMGFSDLQGSGPSGHPAAVLGQGLRFLGQRPARGQLEIAHAGVAPPAGVLCLDGELGPSECVCIYAAFDGESFI